MKSNDCAVAWKPHNAQRSWLLTVTVSKLLGNVFFLPLLRLPDTLNELTEYSSVDCVE